MNLNICTGCGKEILPEAARAHGIRGDMHYRCFKVGTAHGQIVSREEIDAELAALYLVLMQLDRCC